MSKYLDMVNELRCMNGAALRELFIDILGDSDRADDLERIVAVAEDILVEWDEKEWNQASIEI